MGTLAMGTLAMGTRAMGTRVTDEQTQVRDGKRKVNGMKARLLKVLIGGLALAAVGFTPGLERTAQAQEILVSGPLAGAPAVRKQRLYRDFRLEIAPQASFTLLDEYQRLIMIGARLNFNLTDWLAIGGWGAIAPIKQATGLTERIQDVNARRQGDAVQGGVTVDHRLTAVNIGHDFEQQLGTIDWVAAPQLTLVPFRGKIGLFQSLYIDTDLYLFGGPAFVGVSERAKCANGTTNPCAPAGGVPGSQKFTMESRMAIAPTFGLGFQFYFAGWGAIGIEWRGLPFSRNTGGFDNHGGGPNDEFPDLKVDEKDREFKFNQMIGVSIGVSLPFDYKVSE
jgi:hypothetical protein